MQLPTAIMTFDILHGDSLDTLKALADRSVDAVVTDPPYSSGGRQQSAARGVISKGGDNREHEDWFIGDNMGTDTYLWFMREVARELIRVSKPGAPAYVFTDWRQLNTVVTAFESVGWTYKSLIVWDKAKGGAMGSWWRNNHELIPAFVKGKAAPLTGGGFFNTWTGTKPQGGEHPTMKPVGLMRYIVSSITPKGGLILDPFAGSGTTGVAAVHEGYRFLGVERDAKYVAIAQERILSAATDGLC